MLPAGIPKGFAAGAGAVFPPAAAGVVAFAADESVAAGAGAAPREK